jgi:hypothetical protein
MREPFEKANDDLQRMSKDNYDTMLRSYGELNKGMQSIASSWTDYSKRSFEDATHAFEQLIGAKTLEQAFEVQSQYAKKAYDGWMAQASKLTEMHADMARGAYRPASLGRCAPDSTPSPKGRARSPDSPVRRGFFLELP